MTNSVVESKRFVVRKSLIGKNVVITFTNKKGDNVTYNHDKVYEIMKDKLVNLPCWIKYKSYTATNNILNIITYNQKNKILSKYYNKLNK